MIISAPLLALSGSRRMPVASATRLMPSKQATIEAAWIVASSPIEATHAFRAPSRSRDRSRIASA